MYAAYGAILYMYQVTVCIIYATNWQLNNAPPPPQKKNQKTEKYLENLTKFWMYLIICYKININR